MSDRCKGGCELDFDEFPDMRHAEDECSGPECTCYEVTGGHQMGCCFYGKRDKPVASELVEDLTKNERK
jgi:hypothetical protein